MWELDCEEGWVLKNWCFWTVVLEKTLASPLDCKEIQPVHSEGDQPWDFFGRNDAKAETPVLWEPHAKSWLIGKDSDAGRDWVQEEKGTREDEMAGWHHWLDGHKSEWTLEVGDGYGGLACCDSWGCKESDMTEELNWTELNWCLERLKAGGERDDRGWDSWMASLTWWTWVWISSGSWWWIEKPGVLQSMGLQRVRHDWVTGLNWTGDTVLLPRFTGRKIFTEQICMILGIAPSCIDFTLVFWSFKKLTGFLTAILSNQILLANGWLSFAFKWRNFNDSKIATNGSYNSRPSEIGGNLVWK